MTRSRAGCAIALILGLMAAIGACSAIMTPGFRFSVTPSVDEPR